MYFDVFFLDKKKNKKPTDNTLVATGTDVLGVVTKGVGKNDEHQTTVGGCSLAARACTEVVFWSESKTNLVKNRPKCSQDTFYHSIGCKLAEYHSGFL